MNASTITVHWHNDNQPIYSVDFQPNQKPKTQNELSPSQPSLNPSSRLVTGGGDNNIRVWKLNDDAGTISIEYLSTLRKHTQAVNVVRFNKTGEMLASAGDDGTLMIWKLADRIIKDFEDEDEDDEAKESWQVLTQLRSSTSEINDISWSPDSRYLVSGSMDNTLRVYKLEVLGDKLTGRLFTSFDNHNHYVQGVFWDPLNDFIASQSADRSVNIYKLLKNEDGTIESIRPLHKFSKIHNHFLYHSETLQSFFRRLCFSPDGSFLLTPAGIENDKSDETMKDRKETNENISKPTETSDLTEFKPTEKTSFKAEITSLETPKCEKPIKSQEKSDSCNTFYIYLRSSLSQSPILKISGLNKPAIAISFNPIIYQTNASPLFKLPYKMIFAVATQDSIIIYSTEEFKPLGFVSNLHYSSITDLKWDLDGSRIIVSSTDGFCSVVSFENGIFGEVYVKKEIKGDICNKTTEVIEKEEENVPIEEVAKPSDINMNIIPTEEVIPKPESTERKPSMDLAITSLVGQPIELTNSTTNVSQGSSFTNKPTVTDFANTSTNTTTSSTQEERHPKPHTTIDQLLKKPKTTKKRIAPTLISN